MENLIKEKKSKCRFAIKLLINFSTSLWDGTGKLIAEWMQTRHWAQILQSKACYRYSGKGKKGYCWKTEIVLISSKELWWENSWPESVITKVEDYIWKHALQVVQTSCAWQSDSVTMFKTFSNGNLFSVYFLMLKAVGVSQYFCWMNCFNETYLLGPVAPYGA